MVNYIKLYSLGVVFVATSVTSQVYCQSSVSTYQAMHNLKQQRVGTNSRYITTQSGKRFRIVEKLDRRDILNNKTVSIIRLIPSFKFADKTDWTPIFEELWQILKPEAESMKNDILLVRISEKSWLQGGPSRTVSTGYTREQNRDWEILPPDMDPTPHLVPK